MWATNLTRVKKRERERGRRISFSKLAGTIVHGEITPAQLVFSKSETHTIRGESKRVSESVVPTDSEGEAMDWQIIATTPGQNP